MGDHNLDTVRPINFKSELDVAYLHMVTNGCGIVVSIATEFIFSSVVASSVAS